MYFPQKKKNKVKQNFFFFLHASKNLDTHPFTSRLGETFSIVYHQNIFSPR